MLTTQMEYDTLKCRLKVTTGYRLLESWDSASAMAQIPILQEAGQAVALATAKWIHPFMNEFCDSRLAFLFMKAKIENAKIQNKD
jgi:hypothetical protein